MAERPIIFSAHSVVAILAGRKTQTRRIARFASDEDGAWADAVHPDGTGRGWIAWWGSRRSAEETAALYPAGGLRCPYGAPGEDRLWVRETWASCQEDLVAYRADGQAGAWMGDGGGGRLWIHHGWIVGAATVPHDRGGHWMGLSTFGGRWRPSIHMPRWASRLTLEITGVRVERLQAITPDDVEAEGVGEEETGCDGECGATPCSLLVPRFRRGWDSINGKRAPWSSNPWVWVLSFKRAEVARG